jgi:hypothetical protein
MSKPVDGIWEATVEMAPSLFIKLQAVVKLQGNIFKMDQKMIDLKDNKVVFEDSDEMSVTLQMPLSSNEFEGGNENGSIVYRDNRLLNIIPDGTTVELTRRESNNNIGLIVGIALCGVVVLIVFVYLLKLKEKKGLKLWGPLVLGLAAAGGMVPIIMALNPAPAKTTTGGEGEGTDCVGAFVEGQCSVDCGGGIAVNTFVVERAATGNGMECEAADGETIEVACNEQPFRSDGQPCGEEDSTLDDVLGDDVLGDDGWTMVENSYTSGYATSDGQTNFSTLDSAKVACMVSAECNAITLEGNGNYTLRRGDILKDSPSGETTWFMGIE